MGSIWSFFKDDYCRIFGKCWEWEEKYLTMCVLLNSSRIPSYSVPAQEFFRNIPDAKRHWIVIISKYRPFGNGCLRNFLKYLTGPNQSTSRQNTSPVWGTTCIMRIFELLLIENVRQKRSSFVRPHAFCFAD